MRRINFCAVAAMVLYFAAGIAPRAYATSIGPVNFGDLPNYLFFFADGSSDANWQGSSKGFIGDVAIDGIQADERSSGTVPYQGTIFTSDSSLGDWQDIVPTSSLRD